MDVSVSAVTNTVAYDALGRQIAQTDGRANTRHTEYNTIGQRIASIDALGNRTTYSYDQFGNLSSVTDPLGNATVYEYDLRGRKIYEGGATYPVRYTYDIFGNKTTMTTYRDETSRTGGSPVQGDVTTWLYDIASGSMTNKVYADGNGPSYTYTPDGKLSQRTWARGVFTTYAYDGWNQLVSMTYSDDTPSVTYAYDALGRPVSATDAAGTTITAYDAYGDVASESVSGLYSKTLTRHCDAYGRDVGYTLDNSRKNIIEFESDTARLKRVMFAGAWYTYGYLPGTDLKSSLTVGTAGRTDWTYEPNRDILMQVKNTAFGSVVSQYDYVSDAIGRRTEIARSGSRMTESRSDAYGYNDRSELTNAVKNATLNEYAYQYDDIGNRLTSLDLGETREYAANNLNQYANMVGRAVPSAPQEEFAPQYDLDGNQTLVQTSTGIWSVIYNGENRPISWTCGETNITMQFDRMGRRVEYLETESIEESVISDGITNIVVMVTTNAHHRFVYDGYLCIQRLNAAANNAVDLAFGWDPSEPVATRPLWMQRPAGSYNFFYFHDGNKNVSELVSYQSARGVPAHYEYAPFGALTAATTNTAFTAFNVAEANPYRFSSEYADDALGLVYYNYRHYEPQTGRLLSRDPVGEFFGRNLMALLRNSCIGRFDNRGLCCCGDCQIKSISAVGPVILGFRLLSGAQKDFGTISIEKLLDDFSDKVIEDFVKKHGDSLVKSIYDANKKMLDQIGKCEIVANFSISTGFLIHPQLEVATKWTYYRRDCTREWWQFGLGDCNWHPWVLKHETQSKWVSPPDDLLMDSQFDVFEIIRDPGSVFGKVRDGLQNIVNSVDSEEYTDVERYKSKIGCEYVEDLE